MTGSGAEAETRVPARQRVALLVLVLLAAALRFSGLDWGLRHPLHTDERVYVDNVVAMVNARDLDHRFYTYPALFFYLLAPGVAALDPVQRAGPDAFLMSRFLVSAFGVFNVALVAFVGARLLTPTTGLVAACLMAVSPLDVRTSHEVRPDVLLETAGLLALLAFRRVGPSWRADAGVGVLIGAAASVKFTGLLLIPAYVARRLSEAGPRIRGLMVAGATTIAVGLLCTPYALLHAAAYRHGPPRQLAQYYPGSSALSYAEKVLYFIDGARSGLGPIAAPLFLAGAYLALRGSRRFWGAALLHPFTTLLVMSTGSLVFHRYVLPAMGLVYLLTALPLAVLGRRRPWLAAAVLAAAIVVPLQASASFSRYLSQPSPRDKALDWIEQHVPPGSLILETRHDADASGRGGAALGVDPRRYEFLHLSGGDEKVALRLLVPEVDLVVTGPGGGGAWGSLLETAYEPRGPADDIVLRLKVPRTRPTYREIDVPPARLRASDDAEGTGSLVDGDPQTAWSTAEPMSGDEWLQVEFPAPTVVSRIELVYLRRPSRYDPELRVFTTDGSGYKEARAVSSRPEMIRQPLASIPTQRLLLAPRPIRGLRIHQMGARPEPWTLVALRLEGPPDRPLAPNK